METQQLSQDRPHFISPVLLLIYLTVAALVLGQITWAGVKGSSFVLSVAAGASLLTILSLFRWLLHKAQYFHGPVHLLQLYSRWARWPNVVKVFDIYGLKCCIASLFYCFGLVAQVLHGLLY